MTHTTTRRGFTLIELLVVVIIIAILAAIALPQYQKAVLKARVAKIQTIINAMDKAIALYILENGFLSTNVGTPISFDKLDIDVSDMFDSCTGGTCSFDNGTIDIDLEATSSWVGFIIVANAENQLGRFEIVDSHNKSGHTTLECRYSLTDNEKAKPLCEMLKNLYPTMESWATGS